VLFRGAARMSRQSLRMESSQAERRNGTIHGQPRGNRVDARIASGFAQDTKLNVYSRRPTEPYVCVRPGDAAIAACRARVLAPSFPRNFGTTRFVILSILV